MEMMYIPSVNREELDCIRTRLYQDSGWLKEEKNVGMRMEGEREKEVARDRKRKPHHLPPKA